MIEESASPTPAADRPPVGATQAAAVPSGPVSTDPVGPATLAAAPPAAPPPFGLCCRAVTIDVPATTANLGAGFDALAMALDITNRIHVEVLEEPVVELSVEGYGAGELGSDRKNRFVLSLELGLRWALGEVPAGIGWRVSMVNRIPFGRGLGSSASAVVAGFAAADQLTGGRLDQRRQLALASEIEGHPDNAAAALLGGFVAVTMVDGWPEAVRFDVPRMLRAVVFIPEKRLDTGTMRAALPREVAHRDAVFNVGRTALAVAGMATGRYEFLRVSTEDRLHEPYRAKVFPELPLLVRAARSAGAIGACLSGSGSTVIAFGDEHVLLERIADAFIEEAARLDLPGSAMVVAPRNAGALIVASK
jgi:homoserine kinase